MTKNKKYSDETTTKIANVIRNMDASTAKAAFDECIDIMGEDPFFKDYSRIERIYFFQIIVKELMGLLREEIEKDE